MKNLEIFTLEDLQGFPRSTTTVFVTTPQVKSNIFNTFSDSSISVFTWTQLQLCEHVHVQNKQIMPSVHDLHVTSFFPTHSSKVQKTC